MHENSAHLSDPMRCASATAHEASDQLIGQRRDLALLYMVQALIEPLIASCPLPRLKVQDR
ncbi:hypothetical protein [Pseudomonas syringae]|uniref:Uncharacterized protein n=2 Tax=Pseudomonas syringae group TaxID=136849 RepID=A0A261WDM4_9PSED|nr:hypothetical protein JN853_01965 [Pseudomonas syringae pv. actinidiae ICMP 9853]AQX56947.1 hypothetical protein B1R35_01200 [Pseudomonas syringae pv. actinidiae]AYL83713.1 hypothetical protein CN228_30895 [Pseudomonas syringae pv. actinidiae str. Shaanxi_M228]MBL3827466.1 hypothetical protein [Pseudomonas syringae pv. theae]NAT15094.1 hypothetical protein [Pseudomonas syringae pv. actinidifoliorum]OZI84033.1 hypothetical protein CFN58_27555 [Pseudomonas avellanae]